MSPRQRWAPALRVARREALRSRGRSILVLVMIALPVLGVTAADVVIQTSEISGAEAIERRIGTADARVSVERGTGQVAQTADPDTGGLSWSGGGRGQAPRTLDDVEDALGREVEAVELVTGGVLVETDAGRADVAVTETDWTSDLVEGTYRLTAGRMPEQAGEVAINGHLAERGYALGDELEGEGLADLTIVGIGENTSYRGHSIAVAQPGTFDLRTTAGSHTWLVDAGGEVAWKDVRALNAIGATVLSRAVLIDPPADSELDPELGWATGTDDAVVAVAVLVVAMALLEVVLLAGPAFAVIARRLQRSLALMAATGATPPQARRVVLASGLVLGTAGAALGVGLGLLAAWLALPVVQRFSDSYLGPYDVPWLHLLGIAAFGLVSALLAAVVPAWLASRQDVVAVLAGRRGDARPSLRSPLLGLVLLAAGAGGAAYGAVSRQNGEYVIAGSAIVAVLGMILLVPVVVATLARVARGLPLPLRYAVRDAARHRTRTVPAVSAVAATVAGVVALGIANASDAAENEATYAQSLPMGQASLTTYRDGADWDAYRAVAEKLVPGAEVTPVQGVDDTGDRSGWTEVTFRLDGEPSWLSSYGSSLGTSIPVAEAGGALPGVVTGLDDDERARAEDALSRGGVVVFVNEDLTVDEATVVVREYGPRDRSEARVRATVPAATVQVSPLETSFQGVLSAEAAEAVGVEPEATGLLVAGVPISEAQEQDVQEALAAVSEDLSFYVERGYQADDETVIVLLVLGALGGVLMLGGTLTATFLSLSDARPDLATLAAIGAAPRTRRGVAASYAAVIGLVGAALGAAVGFIPGIAVTYPLTGWSGETDPSLPTHFLDVPWLLIGSLVVALPLVTALVVGLTTRSRLPLVARID
ncbi:ABC transporter permease [Nocardioides euryhalodurans]|uniref:ABC transporter permease n=1 Tax=Nocardioides euryhalodurans TaxID=2518370 RepID=A0A4P7GMB8_9ACTN|nr:ABC transporter permease [Nocardioides euryhalodurans]QBR93049.1 ABC transporter permease [Nocardioides euryhalodurans]